MNAKVLSDSGVVLNSSLDTPTSALIDTRKLGCHNTNRKQNDISELIEISNSISDCYLLTRLDTIRDSDQHLNPLRINHSDI